MTERETKMVKPQSRPSQTLRIDILPHFGADTTRGSPRLSKQLVTRRDGDSLDADDFRSLFVNGYDATLITDRQGTILTSNTRAGELLAYTDGQLRRMPILTAISGADNSLLETIRGTLDAERFVRISAWCLRADGSFFAAEIAVNKLSTKRGPRFCFFIRDETRRRQAEEELNTTHTAIHNAGTGIAVCTLEGEMTYVNPALCRLWRQNSAEAVKRRPLRDLLEDAHASDAVIEAIKQGRAWESELKVHPTAEEEIWIQAQAVPNYDSENQLIGLVLSLADISDKKRMEETLRDIERDRVMMQSLGAVCHHLGQPATVLLSSIELMMRSRDRNPEMLDELLKMSAEAANLLRQTLHELNDLRNYKTVPYLKPTSENADRHTDIIDLQSGDENGLARTTR